MPQGAGEILLNCIDKDGTNSGFDIGLVNAMKAAVTIPVIASSGAGSAQHFVEVFEKTPVEAALAVRSLCSTAFHSLVCWSLYGCLVCPRSYCAVC